MVTKKKNTEDYTAKDIFVLKGLDPVRKRPGMYIGSTGIDGLHHLVWECVDNGLDEAMAGYADEIKVVLLPNNYVSVADNGRGIPVDIHKQTKKSALETVMTTLHAGAKFGKKTYQVSGGLHGVGVSVVCALSVELKADICRDGYIYTQEFSKGKAKSKVKKGKKCPVKETGTTVTFKPDKDIFETVRFDRKIILNHLRRQAYLTKGTKIIFKDLRDKENEFSYVFYFEGGLRSYVRYLSGENELIHENPFYVSKEKDDMLIEVAFQYTREMESYEESFANNIYTVEGGAHLTGFRSALTRAINDYAKNNDYLKEGEELLNGKDVKIGINAVVSVKLKEPQFEGQTKGKLGNPEAKTAVEMVVNQSLQEFLEQYPQDARAIVQNSMLAAKARMAASAARKTVLRKGVLDGLTLPGKLSDCSSKNPEESELFIVEGQSAGGCFSGDTKVALSDGRSLSFKQLVEESKQGKQNYCYTIKDNGRVGIQRIENPHITRREARVIRVTLDNNEEIICTPDHKFMQRDGSYKEAQKLQSGDSLMPLIRKISKLGNGITIDGYEMVYDNNAHYCIFTHILSDNYNIEKQKYIEGDKEKLMEALVNFNHKIKRVDSVKEKITVYDIEIPETHNFALESGVFVHNSCKGGRDRRFQAVLPLRGKVLNVERAPLSRILGSSEIRALIIAMGTAIAQDFDLSKLRYHRIIIASDADIDGAHIRTLLLTLFFRYFRPIIEHGYLYIAQPPLYKIQSGKRTEYAYTEADRKEIVSDMKKGKDQKINIQRYKGLGEMNADQLWDTTMNPENRILLRVTIEDAKQADRIFDILMGKEVAPRKKFIKTHAKSVKNLDI